MEVQADIVAAATIMGYIFPTEELWEDGVLVVSRDTVIDSTDGNAFIGQRFYQFEQKDPESMGEWVGPYLYQMSSDVMPRIEADELLALQNSVGTWSTM